VQESTSGIRTKPGMDGDACFKSVFQLTTFTPRANFLQLDLII
jgi:hypothetical protein